MKFNNPNGKAIGEVATMLGGLVLGAMASRAAISAVHTPTAGADDATAKKEKTMLLVKRGVVIAAAGYAGAGITGNDTTSTIAKAACAGAAAIQVLDGVKDFAATSTQLADTGTKTNKAIRAAFGLACPCDANAASKTWGMGRTKRRALREPYVTEALDAGSIFDKAILETALSA